MDYQDRLIRLHNARLYFKNFVVYKLDWILLMEFIRANKN